VPHLHASRLCANEKLEANRWKAFKQAYDREQQARHEAAKKEEKNWARNQLLEKKKSLKHKQKSLG
jgi:hypothetical protein